MDFAVAYVYPLVIVALTPLVDHYVRRWLERPRSTDPVRAIRCAHPDAGRRIESMNLASASVDELHLAVDRWEKYEHAMSRRDQPGDRECVEQFVRPRKQEVRNELYRRGVTGIYTSGVAIHIDNELLDQIIVERVDAMGFIFPS